MLRNLKCFLKRQSACLQKPHRVCTNVFSDNGCRLYSTEEKNTKRADPMAKRPNRLCDPYGQGGEPLASFEVEVLKDTISGEWSIEYADIADHDPQPIAIQREFTHPDFLSGARFIHKMAAVAQMNAHFPAFTLDRKIVKKNWQIVTTCRCHTFVLGGLSTHDFHIAMLIDVEAGRPEVKELLS